MKGTQAFHAEKFITSPPSADRQVKIPAEFSMFKNIFRMAVAVGFG
jgi:hypothetical protein